MAHGWSCLPSVAQGIGLLSIHVPSQPACMHWALWTLGLELGQVKRQQSTNVWTGCFSTHCLRKPDRSLRHVDRESVWTLLWSSFEEAPQPLQWLATPTLKFSVPSPYVAPCGPDFLSPLQLLCVPVP